MNKTIKLKPKTIVLFFKRFDHHNKLQIIRR